MKLGREKRVWKSIAAALLACVVFLCAVDAPVYAEEHTVDATEAAEHEGAGEKADTAEQTGWVQNGDVWNYKDDSGAVSTGWQEIGGQWYYFDDNGTMASDEWRGFPITVNTL